MKFHFYRCTKGAKELLAKHKKRRLEFGRIYNNMTEIQRKMIVWTDETMVCLHGVLHKGHMGRYNKKRAWGSSTSSGDRQGGGRPNVLTLATPTFDRKIMMFGAVCGMGLKFNPYVWAEKEKIGSMKYIKMLKEHLFPELRAKNPLHPNSLQGYFWMQVKPPFMHLTTDHFYKDGAGCHSSDDVRKLLEQSFGKNFFASGRGGKKLGRGYDWPPYSPDLTPLGIVQ